MLNDKIKELRTAHNLTQVELAQSLNITKQSVSNWENNNIQPSVDMLGSLADYFGVTTDYLLCRDSQQSISVDGLSNNEIAHINWIIKDLRERTKQ